VNSFSASVKKSFQLATHAIIVVAAGPFEDHFTDELYRSVRRGIALELFLSNAAAVWLRSQPFILSRLFKLRDSGLSIFELGSGKSTQEWQFFFDFRSIMKVSGLAGFNQYEESMVGQSEFPHRSSLLEDVIRNPQVFEFDPKGILIRFSSADRSVSLGKNTRLDWMVERASRVEIDGIGEVYAKGTRGIVIKRDTILVLRATAPGRSACKALFISSTQELRIDYDLDYLNPSTGQFYNLRNASIGDVYGVSSQMQVRLRWRVTDSVHTVIEPFDITADFGEHIFQPQGQVEIQIRAMLANGSQHSRRIIIREFPVPIFRSRFIIPDPGFFPPQQISLTDNRKKAADWLRMKGWMDHDKAVDRLRGRVLAEHSELTARFNAEAFGNFYQRNSVQQINKSIFVRLRRLFQDEPASLEIFHRNNAHYV